MPKRKPREGVRPRAVVAITGAVTWRLRRGRVGAEEREGPNVPRRADAANLARSIEATLSGHGTRAAHETVREYVARVCPGTARAAATTLVALYEGARWGGEAVNLRAVRSATEALREALAAAKHANP